MNSAAVQPRRVGAGAAIAGLLPDREERLVARMSRSARACSSLSGAARSAAARASESFVSNVPRSIRSGRDRLLDEHQRAVLGELQVALGLREAHDLGLRAIQAQLGRLQRASSGSWLARMPIEPTVVSVESISISSEKTSPSGVSTSAGNFVCAIV